MAKANESTPNGTYRGDRQLFTVAEKQRAQDIRDFNDEQEIGVSNPKIHEGAEEFRDPNPKRET